MAKSTGASLVEKMERKFNAFKELLNQNADKLNLSPQDIENADLILELYGREALKAPVPNQPKPVLPVVNHYRHRIYDDQPEMIMVRLYGMDSSKSVKMGHGNGLNLVYKLNTSLEQEITDPNDIAFFIKKTQRNPEYYEITHPEDLMEKVNAEVATARKKEFEKKEKALKKRR